MLLVNCGYGRSLCATVPVNPGYGIVRPAAIAAGDVMLWFNRSPYFSALSGCRFMGCNCDTGTLCARFPTYPTLTINDRGNSRSIPKLIFWARPAFNLFASQNAG